MNSISKNSVSCSRTPSLTNIHDKLVSTDACLSDTQLLNERRAMFDTIQYLCMVTGQLISQKLTPAVEWAFTLDQSEVHPLYIYDRAIDILLKKLPPNQKAYVNTIFHMRSLILLYVNRRRVLPPSFRLLYSSVMNTSGHRGLSAMFIHLCNARELLAILTTSNYCKLMWQNTLDLSSEHRLCSGYHNLTCRLVRISTTDSPKLYPSVDYSKVTQQHNWVGFKLLTKEIKTLSDLQNCVDRLEAELNRLKPD